METLTTFLIVVGFIALFTLVPFLTMGIGPITTVLSIFAIGNFESFAKRHDLDVVRGAFLREGAARVKAPQVYGVLDGRGINITVAQDKRHWDVGLKIMLGLRTKQLSGRFLLIQSQAANVRHWPIGREGEPFRDITHPRAESVTLLDLPDTLTMSAPADFLPTLWSNPAAQTALNALIALPGFLGIMVQSQSIYLQTRSGITWQQKTLNQAVTATIHLAEALEATIPTTPLTDA